MDLRSKPNLHEGHNTIASCSFAPFVDAFYVFFISP